MTVGAYAGVYAGGQNCSSCHSGAMKTAHTASSAGSVTCAGCHNDSTLGASAVVKASWTGKKCTDCHTTASVHTAYETGAGIANTHKATSTAGCGASGVGCHTTYEFGALHAATAAGCATCHAADKNMATSAKTCGQATGCHTTGTFHAGITGTDTTHTATAMTTLVDGGNGYTGNTCADCHTAALKTAHDKTGPTSNLGWTNECTDCHNSTSPVNGSAVVASGWAAKTCADVPHHEPRRLRHRTRRLADRHQHLPRLPHQRLDRPARRARLGDHERLAGRHRLRHRRLPQERRLPSRRQDLRYRRRVPHRQDRRQPRLGHRSHLHERERLQQHHRDRLHQLRRGLPRRDATDYAGDPAHPVAGSPAQLQVPRRSATNHTQPGFDDPNSCQDCHGGGTVDYVNAPFVSVLTTTTRRQPGPLQRDHPHRGRP